MAINEEKLNEMLGKFVGDLGATMSAGAIVIGESLGLYKAMGEADAPVTSEELAQRTNTHERYIRECGSIRRRQAATSNMKPTRKDIFSTKSKNF